MGFPFPTSSHQPAGPGTSFLINRGCWGRQELSKQMGTPKAQFRDSRSGAAPAGRGLAVGWPGETLGAAIRGQKEGQGRPWAGRTCQAEEEGLAVLVAVNLGCADSPSPEP